MMSDVCLSVCLTSIAYVGNNSRTERPIVRPNWHTRSKVKVTRPLYSAQP